MPISLGRIDGRLYVDERGASSTSRPEVRKFDLPIIDGLKVDGLKADGRKVDGGKVDGLGNDSLHGDARQTAHDDARAALAVQP